MKTYKISEKKQKFSAKRRYKKTQMEILELKKIITEIENSNNRRKRTKERILQL